MIKSKSLLFIGAVACTSLFFTSCGNDTVASTETEDVEVEVEAEEAEEPEWVTVTPEDGAFLVKMPSAPEYTFDSTMSALGKLYMHLYILDNGDQAYMIGYNDMPQLDALGIEVDEEMAETMLQGGKSGAFDVLSQYGAESVIDMETSFKYLDKYPALKVKAHNGEHYVYAKFMVKDTRFYQVWEMKSGDYSNDENVDDFFASFQLAEELEETVEE